jgi:preprotein translocase subunit SecG
MPAAITAALYVLFVLNCIFLILVVLLQAGKGDGLAVLGAGGTSTNTILGSRGAASFLSKLTVGSAVLFMVLSVILAYASSRSDSRVTGSVVDPGAVQLGGATAGDGATGADDGAEGEDEGAPAEPEEAGSEDEGAPAPGEEGAGEPAPN